MYASTCSTIGARAGPRTTGVYEDMATKFFEHFAYIAGAMNDIGGEGIGCGTRRTASSTTCCGSPTASEVPLKVRSVVGLLPARSRSTTLDRQDLLRAAAGVRAPAALVPRPTGRSTPSLVPRWHEPGGGERRLLSMVGPEPHASRLLRADARPGRVPRPYGIRSLVPRTTWTSRSL